MASKVKKVTVYGWAIPEDRFRGPGSGTFVDLVYFVDGDISIGDILKIINDNGFKFIPLRYPYGHPLYGQVVQDKITVQDLTIGIEPVREESETAGINIENENYGSYGNYGSPGEFGGGYEE